MDVLERLLEAVEDNDSEQVVQLAPEVRDLFESRRQRESGYEKLAERLQRPETDSNLRETANQYLIAVTEAGQLRVAVDSILLSYIYDEVDEQEAGPDVIQKSIDAEREVDNATDKLASGVSQSDESVPPILVITGPTDAPFPEGLSRTFEYTVLNTGGEPTSQVEVELDSNLGIKIDPPRIGPLSAGESSAVALSGEVDENGVFESQIRASSTDSSDTVRVNVAAASDEDYLEAAKVGVKNLKKDTVETDAPSGLVAKLEQTIEKLNRAIRLLEKGAKGGITGQINASVNLLNAYLNQLDALKGKRVEPGKAAQLRIDANEIISNINTAREIREGGTEDTKEDDQKGGQGRGQG